MKNLALLSILIVSCTSHNRMQGVWNMIISNHPNNNAPYEQTIEFRDSDYIVRNVHNHHIDTFHYILHDDTLFTNHFRDTSYIHIVSTDTALIASSPTSFFYIVRTK